MTQQPGSQPAGHDKPREGGIQGESDDVAARHPDDAKRSFVKQKPAVARRARGAESDPHVEENLDHGLEETFPASDPVSISQGAD